MTCLSCGGAHLIRSSKRVQHRSTSFSVPSAPRFIRGAYASCPTKKAASPLRASASWRKELMSACVPDATIKRLVLYRISHPVTARTTAPTVHMISHRTCDTIGRYATSAAGFALTDTLAIRVKQIWVSEPKDLGVRCSSEAQPIDYKAIWRSAVALCRGPQRHLRAVDDAHVAECKLWHVLARTVQDGRSVGALVLPTPATSVSFS